MRFGWLTLGHPPSPDGDDAATQQRLREQAALRETRRHMIHARATHNPADFRVDPSRVNPWNDPLISDEDGVRYALEAATLYGTARRVADQVAEMRDAGVHHVLCQMSNGYLPHAKLMESMRRFGEHVMPRFR